MAQLLWKNSMAVPQIIKNRITYDSTIPLLGIYPKELKAGSQRDICTPMFIATLFIIVKMWKQLKCPPTDEWISKMWYMHAMEHHCLKKEGNSDTCYNMDELQRHYAK